MKVTLYSPNGTAMETIEAVKVIPICTHSGFMGVVLEDGILSPEKYFATNLPLVLEGVKGTMQQPKPTDQSFTVKLLNDSGDVIRIWHNVQGTYSLNKLFGFKVDGEWVNIIGNIIYEPE